MEQGEPGKIRSVSAAIYRMRRRIATGLAVVFTVFFAYHVVFGRNGVNNYEQKRAQDSALHQQIQSLQQENGQLKDHVNRLKNDPDAIEYEAREKLHYAKPGEVIYTLNNRPQPASDKPAASPASSGGNSN